MNAPAKLSAPVEMVGGEDSPIGAPVTGLPENHLVGANGGPAPTPYEIVREKMEDLLLEARNWADGELVDTQEQADAINGLAEKLRGAASEAEAVRKVEAKPFDDGKAEVQTRYNVYLAPLTNKDKGKVPLAIAALNATLKPYLERVENEKRAAAAEARRVADAAAAAAAEALRAAEVTNLAAREEAEDKIKEAKELDRAANRAANDRAHAGGGARAKGLTRTFTAHRVNDRDAMLHYMHTQPEEFLVLVDRLAAVDVRAGKRQIPGFDVVEGSRL